MNYNYNIKFLFTWDVKHTYEVCAGPTVMSQVERLSTLQNCVPRGSRNNEFIL